MLADGQQLKFECPACGGITWVAYDSEKKVIEV